MATPSWPQLCGHWLADQLEGATADWTAAYRLAMSSYPYCQDWLWPWLVAVHPLENGANAAAQPRTRQDSNP